LNSAKFERVFKELSSEQTQDSGFFGALQKGGDTDNPEYNTVFKDGAKRTRVEFDKRGFMLEKFDEKAFRASTKQLLSTHMPTPTGKLNLKLTGHYSIREKILARKIIKEETKLMNKKLAVPEGPERKGHTM